MPAGIDRTSHRIVASFIASLPTLSPCKNFIIHTHDMHDAKYTTQRASTFPSAATLTQCGLVLSRAFHDEVWQWWGAQYRHDAAPATVCVAWQRELQRDLLHTGKSMHFVCAHNTDADADADADTGTETDTTVVGLAVWRAPAYMRSSVDEMMGRVGWRYWLAKWAVRATLAVADAVEYCFGLRKEHPLYNPRREAYLDEPEDTHDLAENTPHAEHSLAALGQHVREALYRPDDMWYLEALAIHPDFHRQGLGHKLLTDSLNDLPDGGPAPFCNAGGETVAYGPQKLFLKPSKAAVEFYQRMGFQPTVPDVPWSDIHVIRLRYCSD